MTPSVARFMSGLYSPCPRLQRARSQESRGRHQRQRGGQVVSSSLTAGSKFLGVHSSQSDRSTTYPLVMVHQRAAERAGMPGRSLGPAHGARVRARRRPCRERQRAAAGSPAVRRHDSGRHRGPLEPIRARHPYRGAARRRRGGRLDFRTWQVVVRSSAVARARGRGLTPARIAQRYSPG